MKTDYKQQEFREQKLNDLIEWLEIETGFEFTETSSYRIGDNGVHGTLPVRGVDLRCRSKEIVLAIQAFINRSRIYDPARSGKKCCLLHGSGANLHLHLQVHPSTEFMGVK